MSQDHTAHSSAREKLLEHLFVGELMRHLWISGCRDVELLRSEVDNGGYDLVLECNDIIRHIQLKASHRGSKTARVNININLARRLSGCVIWILFDEDTLELGPYLWFGGKPGEPLPPLGDKIARHTKADAAGLKKERAGLRVVSRTSFRMVSTIRDLTQTLFGGTQNLQAVDVTPTRASDD